VGHVGYLGDGHGLADPVDHVRDVDKSGAGSYGFFVGLDDGRVVFYGEIEADLLVDNAVALGTLALGLDHVRVILLGADNFVAGFQRQAEDDGVQCFGGVAVDGDFVRLRAGQMS
jgi:hypothetical protein